MKKPRSSSGIALGGVLLVACSGLSDLGRGRLESPGQERRLAEPSSAASALAQDPLAAIARLEDARSDGEGLLEVQLARGGEPVRIRAAVALGRLPFPEQGSDVTRSLARALSDPSPRVRSAAAFAIGLRADPTAGALLLERLAGPGRETDATVRPRLVEAASRLAAIEHPGHDATDLVTQVVGAMQDPEVGVRVEAVLGPHRWKPGAPDAEKIDQALIEAARREWAPAGAAPGTAPERDAETAWRAVFSLARRKSSRARSTFVEALGAPDVRLRIFGAMGLAAIDREDASQKALHAALGDTDWRVVCEVVRAIGAHPDGETSTVLEPVLRHGSPHVQRVAFEALGNVPKDQRGERSLTARALTIESPSVRHAAFVSSIRLEGDGARAAVELRAGDQDPLARASAATAAQHLSPAAGLPILLRLARDEDIRVIEAACEGLGKLEEGGARQKLVELLSSSDNGVRLAALEALKEHASPADLGAIERCFESSRGEIATEIAFNAIDVAARIAERSSSDDSVDRAAREASMRIHARGLAHAEPYVRRRASESFRRIWPDQELPLVTVPKPSLPATVPLPGVDFDPARRPRVRVETRHGAMVFELFSDEAPVHVHSFLRLVHERFYDGTTFHRVVPDFVIQGGDRRADGNGGASWRGDSLRAEFTPRKFVRGSLGMPRNDDPESGGSQLFVCHRETPHLDGRYTLFGTLVEGFDVLDRIEVGDRIVTARVLGEPGAR